MSLLRIRNLSLSFGGPLLLDGLNLNIESGERVCLVGRNGSGKSTLLKLISRKIAADDGEIEISQGCKVALLDQELPEQYPESIYDVVARGLGETGDLIRRFNQISHDVADDPTLLDQLERVQHELETAGAWDAQQQIQTVLSKLSLPADDRFDQLSGGFQRRVLLAQALVSQPDILLLDEPTNHLDINSIEWLEEFLLSNNGTLLFITHDRRFLTQLATRIIDLDRGVLTDWPGDYPNYLLRKEEWLKTEAEHQKAFDKKLAQEEVWIRQGIKARRTRNEGRVRALKELRNKRQARRTSMGSAKMVSQEADTSGKLVMEASNVSYSINGQTLISGLDTSILRGDKIGIIGPNGVGKTTLLRLLLGELEPEQGSVRQGTKLNVGYFDQRREQLKENNSVLENLSDGRDFVEINGKSKHIISYLQDFLFAPDRVRQPVSALSGGERNRLMLAKLFSTPSNLLILDEPTNDLDIDTLDLLEELLMDYKGTVLLVSHDRAFLDQVATSTLVFEGDARVSEYVGGYEDWLRQRATAKSSNQAKSAYAKKATSSSPAKKKLTKLSFKDQRELEQLPKIIEELEIRQTEIHEQMADPKFYQSDTNNMAELKSEIKNLEKTLKSHYERWESLENL